MRAPSLSSEGHQFNPITLLDGSTPWKRGSSLPLWCCAVIAGCWGTVGSCALCWSAEGWAGTDCRLSTSGWLKGSGIPAHRCSSCTGQCCSIPVQKLLTWQKVATKSAFCSFLLTFYQFYRYYHDICILSIGILSSYWRIKVEVLWNNSGFAGCNTSTVSWNWTIALSEPF